MHGWQSEPTDAPKGGWGSKSFFSLCYLLSVSLCYPPLRLSISPSVYLSVHLSIHLSNYLSIYPSLYLALYLFAYLSTYVPTLHICLSLYLSICLSVYLSIHPSICLFIWKETILRDFLQNCIDLWMYQSGNLPTFQPINLSIHPSILLSILLKLATVASVTHQCEPPHLSLCLARYLSVYLSSYLSTYLSVYLST